MNAFIVITAVIIVSFSSATAEVAPPMQQSLKKC